MNIKFILGPSGSGKTHYCLEAVRAELGRRAEGQSLILLAPEQATFQMEQALLAEGRLRGYHRAYVVSFVRLARLVLLQTEPPSAPALSNAAKQMLLRRLLQEHRQELRIFRRSADQAGFIARLGGMISELRQYQKTPQHLLQQRQQLLQQGNPSFGPLTEKLADLALIYQAYQDYIADRFIDPDDLPDLLSQRCGRAEMLQQAQLWVDGFAGFTPQQYTVLQALVKGADITRISLCLDPYSEQFRGAEDITSAEAPLDDTDLFYPTLQTYRRLLCLFAESCRPGPGKIILPARATPPPPLAVAEKNRPKLSLGKPPIVAVMPRFGRSYRLAQLEHNLFGVREGEKAAPGQGAGIKPTQLSPRQTKPSQLDDIPVQDIVIVETARRRREVEAAAAHILRLCREHDYRFRDIAVILRDFTDYQGLLEETFTDYGIAYFLDQRRSVRYHPLIELLRWAVQVIAGDFKTEQVFNYLKTDMGPLGRSVIDTLENYALSHGLQSRRWHDERPWRFRGRNGRGRGDNNLDSQYLWTSAQLEQYRRQAAAPLLHMRDKLFERQFQPEGTISVRAITGALAGLLEEINAGEVLWGWYRRALEEKDADRAQTHQQIYAEVMVLLDDLVESLGDVWVTMSQYGEILNAALSEMTLALVPPVLDQVLIGAIERSRHPKIKAAFVLGVNEGRFPRLQTAEALFTDAQREQMAQNGFELAPTSTERLLQERYLAYIALTRPSDFLWVSYSLADEKGGVLNPSAIIEEIAAAGEDIATMRLGEALEPDRSSIVSCAQLGRQLAAAFSRSGDSQPLNEVYQELYRYGRGQSDWASIIQRGLAGVTWRNEAHLDEIIVRQWLGQEHTGSVSRLESFAACPFQHFGRYLLGLEQRDELKLGAVDIGSFYHKALCDIFRKMQNQQRNWHNLTDEELDVMVAEVTGNLINCDHQVGELREQSYRNKYLLTAAAGRLGRFCRVLREAQAAGDFIQQEAELGFGPQKAIPGLELALGGRRRFFLHGQIDRVDLCHKAEEVGNNPGIMVIDYKSTGRPFPFAHFYHGLALQLISYLLVLQSHYRFDDGRQPQPAGALYLPIRPQGRSHTGPAPGRIIEPDQVDADFDIETIHKATGVIVGDWCFSLDRTVEPKKTSRYYGFYVNKDGGVYTSRNRAIVNREEMSALLDFCRANLVRLAEGILAGEITIKPYRLGERESPCSICEFSSLCRFDPARDRYRHLPQYTKQQVLQRISFQTDRRSV